MSDPGVREREGVGLDAQVVAHAINGGWIGRGFKLGIGFWLAGLFIAALGFLLFAVFGAALMAGRLRDSVTPISESATPAPAPDNRDWRAKLKAADQAQAESQRYLAAKRRQPPAVP